MPIFAQIARLAETAPARGAWDALGMAALMAAIVAGFSLG